MKVKTFVKGMKGIAYTQAIAAPGLIVVGLATKKPKLVKVGVIWSALVTLDTGRTTALYIDTTIEQNALVDDRTIEEVLDLEY